MTRSEGLDRSNRAYKVGNGYSEYGVSRSQQKRFRESGQDLEEVDKIYKEWTRLTWIGQDQRGVDKINEECTRLTRSRQD